MPHKDNIARLAYLLGCLAMEAKALALRYRKVNPGKLNLVVFRHIYAYLLSRLSKKLMNNAWLFIILILNKGEIQRI